MRMGILSLYLLRRVLVSILLVLAVVAVVVFLTQMGYVARVTQAGSDLGMGRALAIAALRTPIELEPSLPHVVLIGAALAVYRFRRGHEFVAMLQTGRSALRTLVPVFMAGAVLGLVHLLITGELTAASQRLALKLSQPLGPAAQPADAARAVVVGNGDGFSYVIADAVDPLAGTLGPVTYLRVSPEYRLLAWVEAPSGRWTAQGWRLDAPRLVYATAAGAMEVADSMILPELGRDTLLRNLGNPAAIPPRRLGDAIAFAEEIGVASGAFRMRLAWLVAQPLVLGGMAFLAGAIMLSPVSRRPLIYEAGLVVFLGFSLYVLVTFLRTLGEAGLMSVWWAAILPGLAALAIGLILQWRR